MDARLQRRVQRYGWDLAAGAYASLWQAQLAPAQDAVIAQAALAPGERVLDVACGTGLVTRVAARAVGAQGEVVGIDISGNMIDEAARQGDVTGPHVALLRMDAESLALPAGSFDVVLCALGLMYMPDPLQALREMRRVLRPGGRMVCAVWGERARCGWSPVFDIVAAEVTSEVCPLFFGLGPPGTLVLACEASGFTAATERRLAVSLDYRDAHEACAAAFAGGPVALAWSRFDHDVRARVHGRYTQAIDPWRRDEGYRVPGEFVLVRAEVPGV